MKKPQVVLGAVVLGLALIQVVPVDRSNPPIDGEVAAPPQVRAVLRRACYDCHSNETVWPWYARVAPVSWLVARDVREGRAEVNFSVFGRYEPKRQLRKWKEIHEQVEKGEMPPAIYTVAHASARLSAEDAAALKEWAAKNQAGEAGAAPPGVK